MKKVLIVDDSQSILSLIKSELSQSPDICAFYAQTYKEANKLIRQYQGEFKAAILDLGLPVIIVLSKTDKLSKSEVSKSLMHAKNQFFWQEIIPVSSLKKIGIRELEKSIKAALLEK